MVNLRQNNDHREEICRLMQYNGHKCKMKRVLKVGWTVVLTLLRPPKSTLLQFPPDIRADGPCGGVG